MRGLREADANFCGCCHNAVRLVATSRIAVRRPDDGPTDNFAAVGVPAMLSWQILGHAWHREACQQSHPNGKQHSIPCFLLTCMQRRQALHGT